MSVSGQIDKILRKKDKKLQLIADDIALPLDEWITRDKVALDEYPDISVLKDPDTGEVLALPIPEG